MNAFQKMQAAIRKFLGLVIPPAEPEPRGKPGASLTVQGLTKAEADRAARAIQGDIEKALGHPITLIDLGVVKVKLKTAPCDCPACKRRRMAPWN